MNDETIGQWKTMGGEGAFREVREDGETMASGRRAAETIGARATAEGGGGIVLAGRYRVAKRLGEGGMGSVWLAEDEKLDGRKVAIKMLPSILAGKKGAYRQVKAEAMVAMKLSHPNIATVRSFEEDEGGNPFLVMDYVEGEPLDDILAEKGPLGEEETVRLLGPVAAALDYAHLQGVVHRDVKPGNVLVRKDGTPYVLDFGIAREIQETMTRVTGKLSSGTLLYMSPEQLKGRAPKAAQDVYSFAAMVYECLTGSPPFARGQIEWQIVNEEPEELPEGVGSALRAGVKAGLAKEPGERPGTCAGVLGIRPPRIGGTRIPEDGTRPAAVPNQAVAGGEDRKEGAGAGKTGNASSGEAYLAKVRLGREFAAAAKEKATEAERAGLEKAADLRAAGEEALRNGRDAVASALFAEASKTLSAWRQDLEERRKREKEEAERKAREERERARLERERRIRDGSIQAPGTTKVLMLPGGEKMTMVWCPPGSFTMGSPESEAGRKKDEKEHDVTISEGFWMGKFPVTQAQWKSVMGKSANPFHFRGDNLPVESVSWADCQAFCWKAGRGLRLPTEAEWEYACRAGSAGPYAGTGKLTEIGWYGGNSGTPPRVRSVGGKKPNAWGLHDMHGNVWEWCEDLYAAQAKANAATPAGAGRKGYRVLRGGSYWNSAQVCRSANRNQGNPDKRYIHNGFRVAASFDGKVELVPDPAKPGGLDKKSLDSPKDGGASKEGAK